MAVIDVNKIIQVLSTRKFHWKQVEGLICVNTTYGDYNIKLCGYNHYGSPAISINVDNLNTNEYDIINEPFVIGSPEYDILNPIYQQAKKDSEKISRNLQYS